MNGNISEFIDALQFAENAEKLQTAKALQFLVSALKRSKMIIGDKWN